MFNGKIKFKAKVAIRGIKINPLPPYKDTDIFRIQWNAGLAFYLIKNLSSTFNDQWSGDYTISRDELRLHYDVGNIEIIELI
tara:strand:+ start:50 stop:295 length:246 start_codon:yes stop_codon:yes gene_type:complete